MKNTATLSQKYLMAKLQATQMTFDHIHFISIGEHSAAALLPYKGRQYCKSERRTQAMTEDMQGHIIGEMAL